MGSHLQTMPVPKSNVMVVGGSSMRVAISEGRASVEPTLRLRGGGTDGVSY